MLTTDPTARPARPALRVSVTELVVVLASFSLVMVGNGLLLTLLGVRSTRAGFDGWVTGAVLGGYYVGFLAGSRHGPALLRRFGVGHALALLGLAMALIAAAPGLAEVAWWWIALRIAQGYAISASYVVMEAFLNGAVDDRRRGRLLGAYMVVTMAAFAAGAFAYRYTGADGWIPFAIAGAITLAGAAGVSFAHSSGSRPASHLQAEHARLTLAELFRIAPIAVATGSLVGAANGAIMNISVFAEQRSLSDAQTALLSAAGALGPIVLLYPLGAASDRLSRHGVLAGSAATAAALLIVASGLNPAAMPIAAVMFVTGGLTVTLYTLTSAASNDGIAHHHLAGVGSFVVLLYGIGAIAGSFLGAIAIDVDADAYFWVSATPHLLILAALATLHARPRSWCQT